MRTKRDPAEAVNQSPRHPTGVTDSSRGRGGCCRYVPDSTSRWPGTRSPGRSRHGRRSRCAGALATTDQVRADGAAGPQDQPEFLSADWVAADRNRTNVGKTTPPTTRTMNAAATATWLALAVLDQRGRWIGTVQHVHLNHTTGQPEWITVRVGRWVTTRHIAPLAGPPSSAWSQLPYDRWAVHRHRKSLIPTDGPPRISSALYSHYLQGVVARSH